MNGGGLLTFGRNDGNHDGPMFREPWEAQAFALVLSLHERGVFSWTEWATALGDEIKNAQAAGDPDTGGNLLSSLAQRA
jgi:nitrile hydratase accessory protein